MVVWHLLDLDAPALRCFPAWHGGEGVTVDWFAAGRVELRVLRLVVRGWDISWWHWRLVLHRVGLLLWPERLGFGLVAVFAAFATARGGTTGVAAGADAAAALEAAAQAAEDAPEKGEDDEGANDYGCYDRPSVEIWWSATNLRST